MSIMFISQRDPKWAKQNLGVSPLTVGRFGCTTSCVSMISDYFGCYVSPLVLAKQKNLYTKDGKILWLNLKLSKAAFSWREYKRNTALIDESLKNKDKACALLVSNGQHWILPIRKAGNDYFCVDPWTGMTCYALKTYKTINGSAHFVRK